MKSGVYKIFMISSGKIYVGSSQDVFRRKREHFYTLKNHKHSNIYLQRNYNKYGIEDFVFEVLELCKIENLQEKENYYINLYNSTCDKIGFNLMPIAYSSRGYKHSDESRERLKISQSKKVWKENQSKKQKEIWSKSEYKEKMSDIRKRQWEKDETIEKRRKTFSSSEYRLKRSEASKKMWQDKHARENLVKERRERVDENYKKKLSDASKIKWQNEEFKKKYSDSGRKKWENQEYKEKVGAKISSTYKAKWADPEWRAKRVFQMNNRKNKTS